MANKRMRSFSVQLLVLSTLLVSGCMSISPIKVRSIQCCEIKKLNGADAEVTFELEIENPNDFDISVKCYDLGVSINGKRIGGVRSHEPSTIRSKSVEKKTLSIRTSAKTLMSGALMMGLNALLGNNTKALEVEIAGVVVGKAKGIPMRIKLKETYPLELNP